MVKAVARATDEEFVMLKGNARELGASTEYTATEVAGLQLAYARMGFVPDQIRQITGATLDLATATGEDLARSADVVGVTLRGFNLQADQAQRVVDVMTKSFNASSLQLGYFYDAIKYVAPIASEANVSLEEKQRCWGYWLTVVSWFAGWYSFAANFYRNCQDGRRCVRTSCPVE